MATQVNRQHVELLLDTLGETVSAKKCIKSAFKLFLFVLNILFAITGNFIDVFMGSELCGWGLNFASFAGYTTNKPGSSKCK